MTAIIGHRFARGLAPENTIPGLRAALACGVDHVEIDIGVTSDLVPVLVHDPCLNGALTRGPDGAWLEDEGPPVFALSLAELRRYDVGRARPGSAAASSQPAQRGEDGVPVPTLAEVLRAAPDLRWLIELKTDPTRPDLTVAPETMAALVFREVEAAGALSRVTVESFDWRGPLAFAGRLPIALLTCEETRDALWWGRAVGPEPEIVAGLGAVAWAPDHVTLDAASVGDARARGLQVWAWTVNETAAMIRLASWGVAAVITDRPDLGLAAIGR